MLCRVDRRAWASCIVALLSTGLFASPVAADQCRLQPVPISGRSGRLGDLALDLGEADDPVHPRAWQGPLKISVGGAPMCTVGADVAIMERLLLLGHDLLYVATYSGSNNRVYAVDVRSCRVRWSSRLFSGPASYRDPLLMLDKRAVRLAADCRPIAKS